MLIVSYITSNHTDLRLVNGSERNNFKSIIKFCIYSLMFDELDTTLNE